MDTEKNASGNIDFGELSKDEAFVNSVTKFHESSEKVGTMLQLCCERDIYGDLSAEDKVQYDLFLSYALDSLFWSYLRTQGVDPLKHNVKGELDRVRSYMTRAKQVHDRQSMPHVDTDAAERFVRSGLWEPGKPKKKRDSGNGINKRKKFDSDED